MNDQATTPRRGDWPTTTGTASPCLDLCGGGTDRHRRGGAAGGGWLLVDARRRVRRTCCDDGSGNRHDRRRDERSPARDPGLGQDYAPTRRTTRQPLASSRSARGGTLTRSIPGPARGIGARQRRGSDHLSPPPLATCSVILRPRARIPLERRPQAPLGRPSRSSPPAGRASWLAFDIRFRAWVRWGVEHPPDGRLCPCLERGTISNRESMHDQVDKPSTAEPSCRHAEVRSGVARVAGDASQRRRAL